MTPEERTAHRNLVQRLVRAGWVRLDTNRYQFPQTGITFDLDAAVMRDGRLRANWALYADSLPETGEARP